MSLVSIIVPAYNVAEYIESCLNSLLAQTHEEIEVVVVDDGSTDETAAVCAAVARRDARVRIIAQPNAGVSAARNRGVQEARGKYVCFVDSDDAAHPDMVARLLAALSTLRGSSLVSATNLLKNPQLQPFFSSFCGCAGL